MNPPKRYTLMLSAVDFEVMTPYFRDLRKKQNVTSQSLRKIEEGECLALEFHARGLDLLVYLLAAYAIVVRSSEYDLSPEMLDDLVASTVSSYDYEGGRDSNKRKRPPGDDDMDDDT